MHLVFFKSQLSEGIEVEKEHKDLVQKIRSQLKKYGTIKLTDKQIYEIIAKAHIKEKPNYYELLKKYVESEEVKKSSYFVGFKLDTTDVGLLKALRSSHKYLRKIGTGKEAKYIYQEKEMSREQYHKFMEAQANEMRKYRHQISEKLGRDIGESAYHKWITLHAKQFRKLWMEKNHLLVFRYDKEK